MLLQQRLPTSTQLRAAVGLVGVGVAHQGKGSDLWSIYLVPVALRSSTCKVILVINVGNLCDNNNNDRLTLYGK